MVKKGEIQPVAYVPLTQANEKAIEAPTKIDIPNYPDVGVQYSNYSKKLVSGNTFRLCKQESYEQQQNFGWTASNALLTLNVAVKEGKDIYIKTLSLTCYTDINCYFTFADYNATTGFNNLATISCGAGNSNNVYIEFASPIQIKKLQFAAQPNVAVTGRLSVNITGWYEDKL